MATSPDIARAHRDEGAVVILVALAMLVLLGIAAIVIDLAGLRLDRRADRLASDSAATAGAASLNPFNGSDAEISCQVAWAYLQINLADEGVPTSVPNCSVFAGDCQPGTPRQTTAAAGPYVFEITHPVPDGHPLLGGQAINAAVDGVSCQRFAVSILRTRDYSFARVLGFDTGSTYVRSVSRMGAGVGAGEVVPLLVLEPISCDALYTSGQGKVTVSYYQDSPGFIVVDSDGSKTNNPNGCIGSQNWTIDSKGTQNGWIRAIPVPAPDNVPSAILSYALSGSISANPARSFDSSDLTDPVDPADITDPTEPAFTWFRLYPPPIGMSRRITRAPIDWRYNCKSIYPDYPLDLNNPGLGGIPIAPCPDAATITSHIDQVVTAYGGPVGTPPSGGFQQWTTAGYPCTVDDTTWPNPPITVSGNWWVDCPGGLIVSNTQVVTFSNGNVVFDGDIDLRSFGSLIINATATSDHIVYVRSGDLLKGAQSAISLVRTFVYLADGVIDLVGGSGGLVWTAPVGQGTDPMAVLFEDLALWSEAPLEHQIGGQAGNSLTGTFFTPMSDPFVLTGQGGQFQTDAQFLTRRLEIKGQGEVRMKPDPTRQTLIPIREVRLIR